MNELLTKLHERFTNEQDANKKIDIAMMVHSILDKKYPEQYSEKLKELGISQIIELHKSKSNLFLDFIDTYMYEGSELVITKNGKVIRYPIVDVVSYFNPNKTKSELDVFVIMSFFVIPTHFDLFQITKNIHKV